LQESQVANRIKEAFFSERGLAGNVHRLPFDKLFAIDSVKKVRPDSWFGLCKQQQRHQVLLGSSAPLTGGNLAKPVMPCCACVHRPSGVTNPIGWHAVQCAVP
jgi:hypothetical protein